MGCRMSLLKVLLAILNALLSILGIGLIALSVFELNNSKPGTIEHITIVVQIFIGSFVVLTSFLGCFGTCRPSIGLLWSYGICMIILMVFQIYTIIVGHSTDYGRNAVDSFDALWANATLHGDEIAEIEQLYNCCGRSGSKDYLQLHRSIPKDCYMNMDRIAEHRFREGCASVLQENAIRSGQMGLLVKWILLLIEVLALADAALMGITIHNAEWRQEFGK